MRTVALHEEAMVDLSDLPARTLLTPEEVAVFFSVSLKTIYRWYQGGIIEGVRLNRSIRIYRDSVLKLVGNAGKADAEQG